MLPARVAARLSPGWQQLRPFCKEPSPGGSQGRGLLGDDAMPRFAAWGGKAGIRHGDQHQRWLRKGWRSSCKQPGRFARGCCVPKAPLPQNVSWVGIAAELHREGGVLFFFFFSFAYASALFYLLIDFPKLPFCATQVISSASKSPLWPPPLH